MSDHPNEVGETPKPLSKLVETVAACIGEEATVGLEKARETPVELRVKMRMANLQALRQDNLEKIIALASLEMPELVSPDPVSLDWTMQYMRVAQDVCEEEMQRIWARILASEVTHPGGFGKRTLEFFKTLERDEAAYFARLGCYAFLDERSWPMLFLDKFTANRIAKLAVGADLIEHFAAIGLLGGVDRVFHRNAFFGRRFRYFNQTFKFNGPPQEEVIDEPEYRIKTRTYTVIGAQLFHIMGSKPVARYVEGLSEGFKNSPVDLELQVVPE